MQKILKISIIVVGLVVMCLGVKVGEVLIYVPLRILPDTYSLFYFILVSVAGFILNVRSILDLIAHKIDFSGISWVMDLSLLRFYKSIFYISTFSVVLAAFIAFILFR
jgi:hypothetical protein